MTLVLRPRASDVPLRTVTAAQALVARGVALMAAKRAMDTLLAEGETVVQAPTVESVSVLASELEKAGIAMVVST